MAALRVEATGPVATLMIDNPGKRNAVSAEMWQQFEPLLAGLAVDNAVKVVVVRGAGQDFTAGADIADLDRILAGPGGGVMTQAENAIAAFPKPTIAAIDGYCVGGGWEIAGACDIRMASDRSTFGITPSRLGIVYPVSGIKRLVSIAGPAVAKYLLFSGELVPTATALSLGLVSKVVPTGTFWDDVQEFAVMLAARSQLSIHAMKQLIDAIDEPSVTALAEQWQNELSGDRAIGVAAFLGKYPPEFTWGSGVQ